jgi:hypothetical protein
MCADGAVMNSRSFLSSLGEGCGGHQVQLVSPRQVIGHGISETLVVSSSLLSNRARDSPGFMYFSKTVRNSTFSQLLDSKLKALFIVRYEVSGLDKVFDLVFTEDKFRCRSDAG